jgi:hypothetical protein
MFAVSNFCKPSYDFFDAAAIATISVYLSRVTSLGSLHDKEKTLSDSQQTAEVPLLAGIVSKADRGLRFRSTFCGP